MYPGLGASSTPGSTSEHFSDSSCASPATSLPATDGSPSRRTTVATATPSSLSYSSTPSVAPLIVRARPSPVIHPRAEFVSLGREVPLPSTRAAAAARQHGSLCLDAALAIRVGPSP